MGASCRVITFNIRRSACDDGANRWEVRAPHVIQWLGQQQAHILCFQELMPDAARFLQQHLPGYEWAGCGRSAELEDEHCRIAWRGDHFAATGWETFWLSDTPALPGSKFSKGCTVWPRICTVVELYHRSSGRRFRVYNTHLDHACEYSKQEGVRVLSQRIARDHREEPLPYLLMGDFNATPDSAVVRQIFDSAPAPLADFSDLRGAPCDITYHGYGLDAPCKIDYLLATSEWGLQQRYLGTYQCQGVYLSDHYPIIADLCWK